MNPKIKKLKDEKEKNLDKIAALQERNREIDATVTKLENMDIIGMVREMGVKPEKLMELLDSLRANPAAAVNAAKEAAHE